MNTDFMTSTSTLTRFSHIENGGSTFLWNIGKTLYIKSFNNPEKDNLETASVNMAAGVLMPKCL